jgi:hypothetical protein
MLVAMAAASAWIAGCSKHEGAAMTTFSDKATVTDLLRMFREREPEFRREPVKLALWQHGGGPGQGFTSDQLELELHGDRSVTGTFVRTRFDLAYEPPFLAERFTGAVPRKDAEALLALALGGPLFEREHAAERDPRIGDVMKEEWDLSRGAVHAHKTFFGERFPVEYATIRDACHELMAQLAQRGAREVLHQKRGAR